MFELNLLHTCLERVGQPQVGTENDGFLSLVVVPRKLQKYLCCNINTLRYYCILRQSIHYCTAFLQGSYFIFVVNAFELFLFPVGCPVCGGRKPRPKFENRSMIQIGADADVRISKAVRSVFDERNLPT